jgi:hypothetical protein
LQHFAAPVPTESTPAKLINDFGLALYKVSDSFLAELLRCINSS